jgi:glutathione S-transferase
VVDSWDIALYLDDTYPDRPALFAGPSGRSEALFVKFWVERTVHPVLGRLVVADVWKCLGPADQEYFRSSREQRFQTTLEAVSADREGHLATLRAVLEPLRLTFASYPFLGGDQPRFSDYIVFGALQWARCVLPLELFEAADPVAGWFGRLLDLHDGIGRKAVRAA